MTQIDKWVKNLEQLATDNTSGNCPYCGSETDYTFKGKVGEVGYAVIWCKECHKAYVVSRTLVPSNGYSLNKAIPKNLVY